ncbi:MAG: hypothetical protein KBD52_03290 [Candidatus Pacebacteria bacterium]|nr:hypothetical protein [Candidatus Paceibacterota bacterium]
MDKRKLSIRICLLVIFIFVTNFLAGKFHWYSSLPWFDMFMHFLGGFWLALGVMYIFPPKINSSLSILKILLGVFVIGLLWEFFEVIVDANFSKKIFDVKDTLSDLCFDLAGGLVALLYFFKRIGVKPENKV